MLHPQQMGRREATCCEIWRWSWQRQRHWSEIDFAEVAKGVRKTSGAMKYGQIMDRFPGRDPSAQPAHFAMAAGRLHILRKELSAKKVHMLMRNASLAGAACVVDVARAGAAGQHPGNASRDFLRALLKPKELPDVYCEQFHL